MTKINYFIAISDKNDNNTHNLIKEKYDLILNKEVCNDEIIPNIYQELKNHITNLDISTYLPVTISSDRTVPVSTIASINEKFMFQIDDNTFSSKLRIIYFTDKPSIVIDNESSLNDFILSSLFNLVDEPIIKTNLTLNYEQLILIGLNENNYSENEKELLINMNNTQYYTNERINKIGIDKLIYSMNNFISNNPIHIIFDLNVFSEKIFPSVERQNSKYLMSLDDINKICTLLKNKNIVGIDIIGFDASIDDITKRSSYITAEYVRQLFSNILQIKEKKINIYTEDSKFLIYRSIEQQDYEHDIGWRILRDVPNEIKEQLMIYVDSDIKSITITNENNEDEDILIAITTMEEQNQKSYYLCNDIFELCLMPEEKAVMMFEMIKDNE
jgi:arginase family enzyme